MSRSPRPSEVKAKLNRAADLIEEYGWASKPSDHPPTGGFTLLDSLQWRSPFFSAVEQEAQFAAARQMSNDYKCRSLSLWNAKQRDRRKVVRLLRRTARNYK